MALSWYQCVFCVCVCVRARVCVFKRDLQQQKLTRYMFEATSLIVG